MEHGLYWRWVMVSFMFVKVLLPAIIFAAMFISRRVSAYGVTLWFPSAARMTFVSFKAPLGKQSCIARRPALLNPNNLARNGGQAADNGLVFADDAVAFDATGDLRVAVNLERLVANGDVAPAVIADLDLTVMGLFEK